MVVMWLALLALAAAAVATPAGAGQGTPADRPFEVLWNSPFQACQSCSDPRAQLSPATAAEYSITANKGMAFVGSQIALLYSLTSSFPTLRGDYGGGVPCWAADAAADNCTLTPFTNISVVRNGGVPQAADVEAAAAACAKALAVAVPDTNFSGLLILDFEGWRPVAADNDVVLRTEGAGAGFTLSLYTQYSRQLVQQQHPGWDAGRVTDTARQQFDAAAQAMFTAAVEACKLTRPHARVGYYGFPGMISPVDTHPPSFAGPELLWLWRQLDVLAPSDYLWSPQFDGKQVERAQVNVAMSLHLAELVLNATGRRPAVYPYIWIWPRPVDVNKTGGGGARAEDLAASLTVPAAMGADGVILWGSSSGVDSPAAAPRCVLCAKIQGYLTSVAGPVMAECVSERQACGAALCSGHGRCASTLDPADALGACKKWKGVSACLCTEGWAGADCATPTNTSWLPKGSNLRRGGKRAPVAKTDDGAATCEPPMRSAAGGGSEAQRQGFEMCCKQPSPHASCFAKAAATYLEGTRDGTLGLQAALNCSAVELVVDPSPMNNGVWLAQPLLLTNRGPKRVVVQEGVRVEALPGAFLGKMDSLLTVFEADGVTIEASGATLHMRKEDYIQTDIYNHSEHRHALNILGCTNLTVHGLQTNNSGGDGVYVTGSGNGKPPCTRVATVGLILRDVRSTHNYRQGEPRTIQETDLVVKIVLPWIY